MTHVWTPAILLTVLGGLLNVAWTLEMKVEITKHHTCARSIGPIRQLLRFPSSRDYGQQIVSNGRNCYTVSGKGITLQRPGIVPEKDYQVMTDLYIGNSRELQSCNNQEADGCGGIGSCTYCDMCKLNDHVNRAGNGTRDVFALYKGTERVGCQKRIRPGRYNNLSVRFCLPKKEEMLALLDEDPIVARRLWNTFTRKSSSSNNSQGVSMHIDVRLYDMKVNKMALNETARLDLTRGSRRGMISCHSIYFEITNLGDKSN